MKLRSEYSVLDLNSRTGSITIKDLNGPVSVTNDAERVVEAILKAHGNLRIFYYDSMGNRDELCHDGKRFTGFAPART